MRIRGKIGVLAVSVALSVPAAVLYGAQAKPSAGEKLFEQHCSSCHPKGGNIINPAFTLHKKDRDAQGVKTAKDIVGKMRKPGPGMTTFDAKTIPDKDAMKIADYIIKTFK